MCLKASVSLPFLLSSPNKTLATAQLQHKGQWALTVSANRYSRQLNKPLHGNKLQLCNILFKLADNKTMLTLLEIVAKSYHSISNSQNKGVGRHSTHKPT